MSEFPPRAERETRGEALVIPALRELAPEQALRRLELTIVRRLDGLLQGDYLGLLPGPGSEPAEAREYQSGDDVRRMDWNLTARTTMPHVRDLIADRELETWLLVDATASMDFGTGRVEKRDLAVAAVAAVGFLTERAGNRVGAYILQGGGVNPPSERSGWPRNEAVRGASEKGERPMNGSRHIPARTGRAHLFGLLRTLLSAPRSLPGGARRDIGHGADLLRRTVRRRGLVVVVSDFLDEPASWERQLRLLADRQQVLAVEIVDPRELSLPDVGLLTVVDPETGRRREVQTADRRLRERYAAVAAAHRAGTEQALRRAGVARMLLRTDGDWVRDIVRHVVTQRQQAQRAQARIGGSTT